MKRRSSAEEMFRDMMETVKEKQVDLERTFNEYTSNIYAKPNMDVIEDDKFIKVITDLPGVERENIKIDITEDTLEITAQFNEETDNGFENFVRKERIYGKANRLITLPAKIKINESSAKFEKGVLIVILPKVDKKVFEVKVD